MKRLRVRIFRIVSIVLFLGTSLIFTTNHAISGEEVESQKAVLVTGASSGLGLEITKVLAAKGYYVYAGARKKKDLAFLDKMENVSSIRLDVTKQGEIDAAVKKIKKAGRGLYGLVNNAGVAIVAPLIEVEEADLEFLFNVNVYGPYRVTKAFAPLIIESKGRITTISSISGILSGSLLGPYSMSKHAIEAYGDSLAKEMSRFEVQVSLVEPGNYNSKIGRSMAKRIRKNKQTFDKSLYKNEIQRMVSMFDNDNIGKHPKEVADAVFHFMNSDKPKTRYMVVPNERLARITVAKAMKEMLQLNHEQPYSYSKEELIKMMEKLLGEM